MRTGDVGRERNQRGIVKAMTTDDAWGVRLEVELADGRTVHAQPWFPGAGERGDFHEVAEGDRCVCIPMEGDTYDWVALVGGGNVRDPVPEGWDNAVRAIFGTRVEVRRAGGKEVQGVVLRPLLDDLHEVLTALQALVTALTASVPGTAVQNAAILTAMQTAVNVPTVGLAARLTATIADLATSKAGAGTLPHCSPVLRAQSEA